MNINSDGPNIRGFVSAPNTNKSHERKTNSVNFLNQRPHDGPAQLIHTKSINKDPDLSKGLNPESFTSNTDGEVSTRIHFDQSDLHNLSTELQGISLKYNGLCELVCNRVLVDDLLGKTAGPDINLLKQKITSTSLSENSIVKSHLLQVFSTFERMMGFLLRIYPDNIFSISNQWKLVKKNAGGVEVNAKILVKRLEKVGIGTTLKLEVFKKTHTSFSGHSLLIKKTGENKYIFFDPNKGEFRNLSMEDITKKINEQLNLHRGTDIFLTKGDAYLKRLRKKKIIKLATDKIK